MATTKINIPVWKDVSDIEKVAAGNEALQQFYTELRTQDRDRYIDRISKDDGTNE